METIEFVKLRTLAEEGIEGGIWEDQTRIGIQENGARWIIKFSTSEEYDEVVAYQLAQKFFEGIVPETHLIQLGGRLASAQRMVSGKSAHDLEADGSLYWRVRQTDTLRDLGNMVVMDFLVGNPDRHGNNWFVMENGRIAAIDNGFAAEEINIPFTKALKPAYKCLMVDDCSRTPTLISICNSVLARVDGQEVTAEGIVLEYSQAQMHMFIGRWQNRVDYLRRMLTKWTDEIAEHCHNAG